MASVKEDPSFELAFEDVGRRAQEAIEEEIAREQGGPFFDDDAYGDEM